MNKPVPEAIPHAAELLGSASVQLFINQLLLATVIREGGQLVLPVDCVDGTSGYMLNMDVDEQNQQFVLKATKKQ